MLGSVAGATKTQLQYDNFPFVLPEFNRGVLEADNKVADKANNLAGRKMSSHL